MKILVTSANTRMAYVITKALVDRGFEVVVADFIPRALCFYSKYGKNNFLYPSPYTEQEDFIDCLVKKSEELGISFILPVHEETFLIAKHRKRFENTVKLAIPPYEQILLAHSKDQLVSICEKLNVNVPKTRILQSIDQSSAIPAELDFPLILKPRQGGGNFGIEYVQEPKDFEKSYEECLLKYNLTPERVLIQEYIEADQKFSQSYVYSNGEMVAGFCDIHLRDYPFTGGSGTLRESVHRQDLEHEGKKILDHLHWHGVAECEFITAKKDGKPYLIEINPRIWGGINSAVAAGLDIPWLLYCIAMDETDIGPVDYLDNVKTRWFWADAMVFPHYLKKSGSKINFLIDFFNIFSSKIDCDEFNIKDPLPFFVWPAKKAYSLFKYRSFTPPSYLEGEWR